MRLKVLFCVVFLVLVLGLSDVESGDGIPLPAANNQGSDSGKRNVDQREQERRDKDKRELEGILKYLDSYRERELEFIKIEQIAKDQAKQQRLNDQNELDNLEKTVRQQIQILLNVYARQQPWNVEYTQLSHILNKNIREMKVLIKNIEGSREKETREREMRLTQNVLEQIHIRQEIEKKQSKVELPAKDECMKKQRIVEQEILQIIEQKLINVLQRIQEWHAKNLPMNSIHSQILIEMNKNILDFTYQINRIDEQRYQDRCVEAKLVLTIKDELDKIRQYELEQRKYEQPAKSEMSLVQRKKDEFLGDKLDAAIRSRLAIMEERIVQKNPLDKDYGHQKDLLNQDWQKLLILTENIKQRRAQEQNIQNREKQGQQQSQSQLVQQQPQQQLGQGIQRGKQGSKG